MRRAEAYQCTIEAPWREEYGTPVLHEDVETLHETQHDNYPCGDLIDQRCRICGHRWTTELPQ